MDPVRLQKLSEEMKISRNQVIREYWEMLVLKELSNARLSQKLAFKGGTALRLAYGSPRFSDDLDFSLTGTIRARDVFEWSEAFATQFNLRLTDQWEKRNTLLVELAIGNETLGMPFKIKLEISERRPFTKRTDTELRLLTSPTTNIEVLFRVSSLARIFSDKIAALKDRNEPRDLFDLWYVAQKLKRDLPSELPKTNERLLRQTLNKYLPTTWRHVISELAKL